MPELDSSKYSQRLPYGERFTSTAVLSQPQQYQAPNYQDYPDVPEDLYNESDLTLSGSDKERLHTSADGDPLNGYAYGSKARLSLLADEKSATRLGIAHLDRLDTFITKVLRAQKALAGFVVRTTLDNNSEFLAETDSELYLKQEADQPVGSYKLRGAAYKMLQLEPEQLRNGVFAASAGNHAQGVAFAARQLGARATLVMPKNTPQVKIDGVRSYGAEVILIGNSFEDAQEYCVRLQIERPHATYIPPFDDEHIIVGQATVAAEILQQYPEVTAISVPVGGGGLLAGIARYVNLVRPDVTIYGVEPRGSSAMTASLHAGRRVTLEQVDDFAEGVAVAQVGKTTFAAAERFVGKDNMVVVKKKNLAQTVVDMNYAGLRTEPAGALGLAGLRKLVKSTSKPQKFVAIRSGQNIDLAKLREAEVFARAN